ncbi:permease prefix domain 1-containing protein [Kribbella sp. GL6]|uniref:permease prefix domain 1-containing protein n=1 Tax=Kribbella sp. GL6 TaxID=3419765 RepID=UPI003D057EC2
MADHDLIELYLAELELRLSPAIVEELADGLEESVRAHVSRGLSPAAAREAAVREFGSPDCVVAAFVRQSPGRRTAMALLATGPVFAGLWGTALIEAKVWQWQIPKAIAIVVGLVLLVVAGTLATIARSNSLGPARFAGPAGVALILLDLGMVVAVAAVTPSVSTPMWLALFASVLRAGATARNLPSLRWCRPG